MPRDIDKSFGTSGFKNSRGAGSRVGSSGTGGLIGQTSRSDWTRPVSIILELVSSIFELDPSVLRLVGFISEFSVGTCMFLLLEGVTRFYEKLLMASESKKYPN